MNLKTLSIALGAKAYKNRYSVQNLSATNEEDLLKHISVWWNVEDQKEVALQ